MMLSDNRKAILQAIHTNTVNKAINDHKNNILLDYYPHPINNLERNLTRKVRATLAQLRSRYCRILGSYKSRINNGAGLYICSGCGGTPHDVRHLFAGMIHPMTLIPSDLWTSPMDSIREFSYLDAGNMD